MWSSYRSQLTQGCEEFPESIDNFSCPALLRRPSDPLNPALPLLNSTRQGHKLCRKIHRLRPTLNDPDTARGFFPIGKSFKIPMGIVRTMSLCCLARAASMMSTCDKTRPWRRQLEGALRRRAGWSRYPGAIAARVQKPGQPAMIVVGIRGLLNSNFQLAENRVARNETMPGPATLVDPLPHRRNPAQRSG